MGRTVEILTVLASLSRHNSEQDKLDDAAWEQLKREIRALVGRPEYSGLEIQLTGADPED